MGVNREGILYYHNLIDELIDNGIVPFVTLFHWDLPQYLEDSYGGFLSPQIVEDFRVYADLCFEVYGEKVKHWITLNEPLSYSVGGYVTGEFAPGRCSQWQELGCTGGDSATEPYLVSHHQLLAHAAVVHLYRHKYQASQQGVIGIALVSQWAVPVSTEISHRNAAARALDFALGWFMDPITHGDYPYTMRSLVGDRLPKFSCEESQMLNGSFDFIGLNYYTACYAADAPLLRNATPNYSTDSLVNLTVESNGTLIGPKAASNWLYVYPRGFYELLMYIKRKYNNPSIYITENDATSIFTFPGVDEANDNELKGANVKGYFAWSLLDNFEWSNGYTVRFGINYVDYSNGLKRYPKFSASWFKRFLQKHPS
ncbi:hypothetical protein Cgig2_000474 [Carnegiea gigantea]|uniref:Beta-glucosidase n=1 Tax=Carnegiea gigantea TaxID=171969 RepID=A0A9Q1K454_9CARY|nr:hypothetical protein Cgig2_000474 [Carnegiea gigantea]